MRSAAPRAWVSIRCATSLVERTRRHTSSPSMSGSIRSSTKASNGSRASRSIPASPPPPTATRKPAPARYSLTMPARRASSSTSRMRWVITPSLAAGSLGTIRPARSTVPLVPFLHALGDFLALVRRQHLGGVGERLRHPFRSCIGGLHLLGAQPLDRSAVDRRRGKQLRPALACFASLLAQRTQVLRRALGDIDQLAGLLGRRIDFHREVLDHLLDALVGHRPVPAHEAAAVPAAAMHARRGQCSRGAESCGDAREDGSDRRASEEPPPAVRLFHDQSF